MKAALDTPAIRFEDVWRSFPGVTALQGFDLCIPRGSITALLGRNGTGKTTAIKCLMRLLKPDRGSVFALGRNVSDLDVPTMQRVTYLSERQALDPSKSVGQLVTFNRKFYPQWDDSLAQELLRKLGLVEGARVGNLSQGQTRKVGLLLALAARPDLLVLDEPAANLDAVVRREFLEMVLERFRAQGMTVLISTHLLSDVERIADQVAIIDRGRVLAHDWLDDLKERIKSLRVVGGREPPLNQEALPELLAYRQWGKEFMLTVDPFSPELVERIEATTGGQVEVIDLALEEIFLAVTADRETRL